MVSPTLLLTFWVFNWVRVKGSVHLNHSFLVLPWSCHAELTLLIYFQWTWLYVTCILYALKPLNPTHARLSVAHIMLYYFSNNISRTNFCTFTVSANEKHSYCDYNLQIYYLFITPPCIFVINISAKDFELSLLISFSVIKFCPVLIEMLRGDWGLIKTSLTWLTLRPCGFWALWIPVSQIVYNFCPYYDFSA